MLRMYENNLVEAFIIGEGQNKGSILKSINKNTLWAFLTPTSQTDRSQRHSIAINIIFFLNLE